MLLDVIGRSQSSFLPSPAKQYGSSTIPLHAALHPIKALRQAASAGRQAFNESCLRKQSNDVGLHAKAQQEAAYYFLSFNSPFAA